MKLSNVRDNFYLADNDFVNNNEILTDKSKLRMQKSKADNTLKSYAADWNDFADWCELKKVSPLPCLPETIVNYINDLPLFLKIILPQAIAVPIQPKMVL